MIHDIISYIYIHNMSTADQYWWRYGSAGVCFETHHRSIKLPRAVASSILVRCRRFLHVNLDRFVNYRLRNRCVSGRRMVQAAGIVEAWCEISHTYVHNTITSSIWRFFINSFMILSFISLSNTVPNIVPIVELSRFHFAFVSKHCLHRCKKDLAMRVRGLCAVDMRTLRTPLWLCRGLDELSILARYRRNLTEVVFSGCRPCCQRGAPCHLEVSWIQYRIHRM